MQDDPIFSDAPQAPVIPSPGEDMGEMMPMGGEMEGPEEEMEEEKEEKKLPIKGGKGTMNPQVKCINCLASAVRSINQYIEALGDSDPVNAKAARNVIAILGELLKTAQLDETQANPEMPEILS